MLRKFAWLFSLVCLALIGALTISCGSSSSSSTPPPACSGSYNVVGDWQITVTDNGGGSYTGYGAIDSSGLALFFDNSQLTGSGDTVELPTITGNCSFSGNVTAYAEPGGPASGSQVTDAAQGNVTSNTAINGSFTGSGSNPSGTFTATAFTPESTVVAVSGEKTGEVEGALNGQPVLLPLTFTPSGSNDSMSFTTNPELSPNCTVSGTFTEVGTNNVFDVSITFSAISEGGCAITGTFSGLGFESSSDYFGNNFGNSDTYLYADIIASTNTFVMEIF